MSSTRVFCNYPDSSGGMILRIHQIYYSALSGWSDTTYSEKAQGVSIFHSGVGSSSSHANNFPLWTICQLIYIPLKMWDCSEEAQCSLHDPALVPPVLIAVVARRGTRGCYVSTCPRCITLQCLLL